MNLTARELVAGLTPPLAIRAIRALAHRKVISSEPFVEFAGDYASFEQALSQSTGYNSEAVAKRYAAALSSLIASPSAEIDSRFQQVHSVLSYVAARSNGRALSVLDIGGGNGAYGITMRRLFDDTLDWTVLETPTVASSCRGLADISFISDWPSATFDVTLISGTLQYLENPYADLGKAANSSEWLIATRIPVNELGRDKIVIQTVPPHLYNGSMPMHSFCRAKFETALADIGEIVMSWDVAADNPSWSHYGMQSRGYLVKKIRRAKTLIAPS
jgi:putative methyltransferase (TIGR04325 family)